MTKDENNRITRMEEDIKTIKERLDLMPTKEGMELSNKELVENVMEKSSEKFACKTVEKIVYSLVGVILLAVISAILAFVIVKI